MTQTISLNKALLERAAAILRMKSCGLSLDWLKAYSIPQLVACCDRMEATLPGINITSKTMQKELIQNPAFAAYYARLWVLCWESPPACSWVRWAIKYPAAGSLCRPTLLTSLSSSTC